MRIFVALLLCSFMSAQESAKLGEPTASRPAKEITIPAGTKIPVTGFDFTVVSNAGELITSPVPGMPGAGAPNPLCRDFVPRVQDATPENAEALAGALERISNDGNFAASCRARIVAHRRLFDWNDAVAPLVRFCTQPRVTHAAAPVEDARVLAKSAWHVLKTHGAPETLRRLRQHLRSR